MRRHVFFITRTKEAENEIFADCIKLSGKVTVYVPATVDISRKIDNAKQVEATAQMLAGCFGGATSSPAMGWWLSAHGLVKENTTVVFAYAREADLEAHIEAVVEFCREMCRDMRQESIALEVNGEMYFIESMAA